MESDGSRTRAVLSRVAALSAALAAWGYRVTKRTVLWTAATTADTASGLVSWTARASRSLRRLADGPLRELLGGPVKRTLLGRDRTVSALVGLVSPVLALGANWWVVRTTTPGAMVNALRETWNGTDPHVVVFLAVALLVAAGAAIAAVNSGLAPTTLLVSAPVFGAGFSFYGATTATGVVSLPDAVAIAGGAAGVFGVPISVAGFLLGVGLRRVATVLRGGVGSKRRIDGA
jgi:hypothetical protein